MKILLSLHKKTNSPHFIGFFCAFCLYSSIALFLLYTPNLKQIPIKQEGNHNFTLSLRSFQEPKQAKQSQEDSKPIQKSNQKTYSKTIKPSSKSISKTISAKKNNPSPPTQEVPQKQNSNQANAQNTQETLKHNQGITHEFLAKIHSLISSHNPYPLMARRQRLEGEVVIEFILDTSGVVSEVKIVRSNTKEMLQKSAIKAVYAASKYFPLPEKRVKIQVPILYKLH
ncbi:energy transducer TonB [Helicobacter cholecystus]|uniref:Energy transducer TonB n=1 Tax=Helicobacter cholecystus TaxID=45498 RepID=A0A3D8IWF5_9HELI|nr:energy transducer TonB [Helicobacter cholecystus]RDU69617.1 energy transducer TonB [Helicobacter cholecystus]VEJ24176.1 tonB transport protein [Helicobacter cholecystus]